MSENMGALAAALAKAQASFPTISRDKEVTVQTKTGGSYKFKYAPLESIVAAVRKPLSDNGLAVVQLLDDDFLVTSLYHEGGAVLSGRTPIPATEGIQAFGSAITYLRRYSIVALLGIATEEDDDGNHAAGNSATFGGKAKGKPSTAPSAGPTPDAAPDASGEEEILTGRVSRRGVIRKGGPDAYQLVPRQTNDGYAFGFRLEIDGDKAIPQVLVAGPLGAALLVAYPDPLKLAGTVATVSGVLYNVRGRQGSWYRLHVDRFENAEIILPSMDAANADAARGGVASEPTAEPSAPLDPEIAQLSF